MKFKISLVCTGILLFICSCKTTESVKNEPVYEPTRQELEQSKIDTTTFVTLSPDELRRITLMAHNAAKLYCNMKQYDGKDRKDLQIAKAYDPLDLEYRKILNQVKLLDDQGKMEYERVFDKAKEKCE